MFFSRAKEGFIKESKSLRASIRDGMASAVTTGTADSYLIPFGIFLRATTLQIGLLATLPQFVGAFSQVVGAWLSDRITSRRTLLVGAASANAMVWLAIGLLSFTASSQIESIFALIVLALVYQVTLNLSAPIWNSLIGDLVPLKERGQFFGIRNQWLGFISFLTLIICGQILDFTKDLGLARWGFLVIFLGAGISRLIAAYWLAQYEDPPFSSSEENKFSLLQFVLRIPQSNFAKFVLFVATMQFSVAIAGPYFSVYWLNDLKLSYTEFTGIIAAQAISQFLSMKSWGRLSDSYGNRKILKVCSFGIASIPFFWLLSDNYFYMAGLQVYSGIFWAGFNIAVGNFLFDAVTPPKRARCAAYQAFITGIFILIGAVIGGVIVKHLPENYSFFYGLDWNPTSPLLVLFLISGILRFLFASFLIRKFHEVREVTGISTWRLLSAFSGIRSLDSVTDYWVDLFRDQEEGKEEEN
ncbi:MAG: MFS transporter [SAR324 cluster bacterium]|uniref:MFS transporter n=1 Tax=SAR324 cluster bacterium TaxID=2024889 RepID=A0A7X9FT73_9DELT|nr:MFS transporter [SAR324 cluster bacterium]